MKKWRVVMIVILAVLLSGCGMEDEVPAFVAKHDEGIVPWTMQEAMTPSEVAAMEEEQGMKPEPLDVELEADILGIYEISESAEGERMTATSRLTAGKEYEITARILLSAEAEAVLGQELDFLLTCPTVVEQGKKSEFTVSVFANGAEQISNAFTATSTAYDLSVSYVPESYHIKKGDSTVKLAAGDVLWNEDVGRQTLDYLTKVNQQLGVYEYTLSYRVQVEMLDTQRKEVAEQAASPISVRLEGISQQYADDRDKTSALMALNDCLRDNYFMRESMLCEGTAYLTVEVFLPDWAREYAEQYGLVLTWYNYQDAPGCGIGVSLPAFPDNLGHAEASLENIALTVAPTVNGKVMDDLTGALTPCPTTPISIWSKKADEVFALECLTLLEAPSEVDVVEDLRINRSTVTQILGGEIIEKLPATNRFYVVAGADLVCVEGDGE